MEHRKLALQPRRKPIVRISPDGSEVAYESVYIVADALVKEGGGHRKGNLSAPVLTSLTPPRGRTGARQLTDTRGDINRKSLAVTRLRISSSLAT